MEPPGDLRYDDQGLIAAIITDHQTGEVRMLGWMNAEALRRTVDTGLVHFWSRSRQKLWQKGETSGNVMHVRGIRTDCDRDVLLVAVEQVGDASCHLGYRTCFSFELKGDGTFEDVGERVFDPKDVYESS
ncbi:MAG: phosphoribosyl-AMP cyclohydrolase [Armatimonadota bacterium]